MGGFTGFREDSMSLRSFVFAASTPLVLLACASNVGPEASQEQSSELGAASPDFQLPPGTILSTGIAPPAAPACGHSGERCCSLIAGSPGSICLEGGEICQTGSDKYGNATGYLCAPRPQPPVPAMSSPKLVVVYWGPGYSTARNTIFGGTIHIPTQRAQIVDTMLTDVVTGTYMNDLAQYGVGKGRIVESVYLDDQPAAGTHLTYMDLQNRLESLLGSGTITYKPAFNETSLLYVIMPPPGIEIWPQSTTEKTDGVQGEHYHTKYNAASTRDDLIWTMVKTYHPEDPTFIAQESGVLTHELVESFNDPIGGRIEIGDECDGQNGGVDRGTYALPGTSFQVPLYWSQRDHQCVHGDW
jgi:hypothetical protein